MPARRFPRVADSAAERRAHIVDSAAAIIADAGLEGLSVRTVAERAGCSRGLVEHYFRSKAELVLAANRRVNEAYLQRVARSTGALQGLAALEARLRDLLPFNDAVLDEWRVRAVFWRQASTDPVIARDNNQSFAVGYEQFLSDIRHAQAAGEIPADVPVIEASEFLLLSLIGLGTATLGDRKLRTRRALERRIAMLLGLLRTGGLGGLVVGDPAVEY